MRWIIIIIPFLLSDMGGVAQTLTINIPQNHFHVDESNSIIVSRIENMEAYESLDDFTEIMISLNQTDYELSGVVSNLSYSEAYAVIESGSLHPFTLYFTELPLISIQTEITIPDEPKVPGIFSYADEDLTLTTYVGVELRGASSQSYPKKTFDLEFWTDETGETSQHIQFGNLRSDDDWILDALYNEPLRMRSYFASKLWLELHTPSYYQSEEGANSGVDLSYVELFVNGSYRGLYALSEQIDRKLLQLKEYNGTLRGELYQGYTWGASTFGALPPYANNSRTWGGYEMKYPGEEEITDWQNLYDFTGFVMNSADVDFTNEIWNLFDKENLEHYFIFLNLIRATDNTGKNIYLAKYQEDAPYFYVPWDLDGCFGTIWDGSNENITDDVLSNLLMDRVSDLNVDFYNSTLANKWFEHRSGLFDINSLQELFESQYAYFSSHKVYERESILYPEFDFTETELNYLTEWLENRILFLDEYYDDLLTTTSANPYRNQILLYPNPAKNRVFILNNLAENQEYQLLNTKGSVVKKGVITDGSVSLSNLESGLYLFILDGKIFRLSVQ